MCVHAIEKYSHSCTDCTVVNCSGAALIGVTALYYRLCLSLNCKKVYLYSVSNVLTSGGPLSALTCCVNARLLSAIKKYRR